MSDGKRNVTLPRSLSSSDVSPIEKHVELNKLKERPTPLKKGKNILVTQSVKCCLQQETSYEGKILCNTCNKRKSESCGILSRKYSEEEREIFKEVSKNVSLIKDKDGKKRVRVEHIYKNGPEITFHRKNSNFKQAIARKTMSLNI